MFVDTSTKRHLFPNLRARRGRQEDLGEVTLYAHYAPTGGCGSYIHHEHLILGKFLNLRIDARDRSVSVIRQKNELGVAALLSVSCHRSERPKVGGAGNN